MCLQWRLWLLVSSSAMCIEGKQKTKHCCNRYTVQEKRVPYWSPYDNLGAPFWYYNSYNSPYWYDYPFNWQYAYWW